MGVKTIRKKTRVRSNTENNKSKYLHKITEDERLFLEELMKYHRLKRTKYLKNWWDKSIKD